MGIMPPPSGRIGQRAEATRAPWWWHTAPAFARINSGRYLQRCRPLMTLCWCPKSDKSFYNHVLINQLFCSWTIISSFSDDLYSFMYRHFCYWVFHFVLLTLSLCIPRFLGSSLSTGSYTSRCFLSAITLLCLFLLALILHYCFTWNIF